MRKVLFVFSVFVFAVLFLSYTQRNKASATNGQQSDGEVTIISPQIAETLTQEPPIIPTALLEETKTVQEAPTPIIIEPTVDPNLLVNLPAIKVNVEPQAISFHPVLKYLVQAFDYAEGAQVTGLVLEGNLEDVPELSGLGPPCTLGNSGQRTRGYDWLAHPKHTAVDMYCTDMKVASPTKAKVYAILWEGEAYKWESSGMNVLVVAKIPEGYEGMTGWLIFGTGHMKKEVPVTVGQEVEAGQVLGDIGSTGNSTGPHMHYYVVWLKPDGTTEFLNPHNWSAIGSR